MFCDKCGAEVKEGSKFCTKCGSTVKSVLLKEEGNESGTKEERKKSGKAKKFLIGGIATVLIVVLLFFLCRTDYDKFVIAWEKADYVKAGEIYQEALQNEKVRDEIDEYLKNDYYAKVHNPSLTMEAQVKEAEKYIPYIPTYVSSTLLTYYELRIEEYYEREITCEEILQQFSPYKELIPEKYEELERIISEEEPKYDNEANLARGNELFDAGAYEEAMDYYYLAACNEDSSAMAKGQECMQKLFEEKYARAEELAGRGNYDEAVERLLQCVDKKEEVFFLNFDVQEELHNCLERYGVAASEGLLEQLDKYYLAGNKQAIQDTYIADALAAIEAGFDIALMEYEWNCYLGEAEELFGIDDILGGEVQEKIDFYVNWMKE